ncbi:MAG TPA: hypothetical protein VGO75_03865, partial [Gemmatimonadaceae bacterium]|nr:hypothetical protein [Gemmatimonadaceae bacterium]
LVLAGGKAGGNTHLKLLENRPLVDSKATAYVCRGYSCDRPVTTPDALSDQLENAAKVRTPSRGALNGSNQESQAESLSD